MRQWDIYLYPFEQELSYSIFILGLECSPWAGASCCHDNQNRGA